VGAVEATGREEELINWYGWAASLNITRVVNPFARLDEPVKFAADAPGGDRKLFESVVRVTAYITNIGDYSGREVAQLYLGEFKQVFYRVFRLTVGLDRLSGRCRRTEGYP
jgi:hypothetical protein